MNSIYDFDEPRPSKAELDEARRIDHEILQRSFQTQKKWALCFTAAFFLSCASVYPFLYGHPLHVYWEHFGKYLVLLCMALLVPFVVSVMGAINSWIYLRKARKMMM